MSILIVDDSELSRSFTSDLLGDAGYDDIMTCASAEEAFEEICVLGWHEGCPEIDLVLMDINLPGMNGIEACRKLKQVETFIDIPVIIISGVDQLDGLEAAFSVGAMDYITKNAAALKPAQLPDIDGSKKGGDKQPSQEERRQRVRGRYRSLRRN